MKKMLLLVLLIVYGINDSIAQYFVETELDKIANKIVQVVENANSNSAFKIKIKTILVEDFTNTEGRVSKLGANLAEELSIALVNSGGKFMISERELIAGIDTDDDKLGKIGDAIERGGLGLEKSSNEYGGKEEKGEGINDLFDSAGMISKMFNTRSTKYKGIDAIIVGTLTESNDQYRINVKVISADKNHKMLGGTRGTISKTPFILELEAKELQRKEREHQSNLSSSGSLSSSRLSGNYYNDEISFKQGNLEFVLNGCEQMGQNIECSCEIVNRGVDLPFAIYINKTIAYAAENGNEYNVGMITLGDKAGSSYSIKKNLIKNVPLRSTWTFTGVGEDVKQLAKINLRYAFGNSYLNAEFRDVKVRH